MYFFISFILISYYIYLKIVYGGLSFSIFFIFIAAILILYGFLKNHIKKLLLLHKLIKYSTVASILIFLVLEVFIIFYPNYNVSSNCDYMIILGASVKGSTPSITLKGRLDAALDYLEDTNDDLYIVVSGGQGNGENISEASAMRNYLIQNGVREDKIIIEDKSTSTFENFSYSKEKIENHSSIQIEYLNIKVITTDFHTFRSSIIAKRNNYKNVTFYSSKSLPQFMPTYYTREFFALVKTLVFDN
ncbi:YdcF family protein [Clostridium sp.]|uniref:YdcF family protein n=1 Tax=Clostridium sp. TaxID=1506 RepID=UPI003F67FBA7